jgi:hypothetical protein
LGRSSERGGYFIFHDSHWEGPGDVIGGVQHERVDVAITDFFGLPKSVREMDIYEDDNVVINHYKPSFGMTFVQVKTRMLLKSSRAILIGSRHLKLVIGWQILHFNKENPNYVDWNQDLIKFEYELRT